MPVIIELAAGISAIAIPLNEQYKITKESLTEETRKELEKKCDPAKIFSDVFHALSLHRRHSILPFLDSGVKKILDACPIDDFLFGRSFPDQLKSSNEAQRLGSTIKKKDKTPQYLTSKALITLILAKIEKILSKDRCSTLILAQLICKFVAACPTNNDAFIFWWMRG
ncbi:uncharacterized protein LOC126882560 [Diabrotica virgifera virgifera]|uniref:Uncharacterized protein n=1 Tax=Diabrotica virgifera virgifera TaxID=50390 RepID=A0ABM5JZX0_DIAVI|nr:uncharacterized protein LOC126882560 [Diabrotica virgifera virgifera]